jgi:hypothetical protein
VRLTFVVGAFGTRGSQVRVAAGGARRDATVTKDAPAAVTLPLDMPAEGSVVVRIETLRSLPGVDPDNGAGVQIGDLEMLGGGI